MSNMFKKVISLVVCFCMFFTINAFALTSNININNKITTSSNIINSENKTTILENNNLIVKVKVECEDGTYIATLDKSSSKIELQTIEKFGQDEILRNYDVKLNFNNTSFSGVLIDKETGETISLDQQTGSRQKRSPALLAIPWIWTAVKVAIATAGVVTVAGVTWYYNSRIAQLVEEKRDSYEYFEAKADGRDLIAGNPLTFDQAKAVINAYGSVMAVDAVAAWALAAKCGGVERVENHEDEYGYYLPHIHPGNRPKSHIWYFYN